jgi:hypothetical protein
MFCGSAAWPFVQDWIQYTLHPTKGHTFENNKPKDKSAANRRGRVFFRQGAARITVWPGSLSLLSRDDEYPAACPHYYPAKLVAL